MIEKHTIVSTKMRLCVFVTFDFFQNLKSILVCFWYTPFWPFLKCVFLDIICVCLLYSLYLIEALVEINFGVDLDILSFSTQSVA